MPRQITIIGALQAVIVVLGFVALGIHMKFMGYPNNEIVRWNSLAVFLREQGLFFFSVPICWTIYAIFAFKKDKGIFSFHIACALGIIALIFMLICFMYAFMHPFDRILMIKNLR